MSGKTSATQKLRRTSSDESMMLVCRAIAAATSKISLVGRESPKEPKKNSNKFQGWTREEFRCSVQRRKTIPASLWFCPRIFRWCIAIPFSLSPRPLSQRWSVPRKDGKHELKNKPNTKSSKAESPARRATFSCRAFLLWFRTQSCRWIHRHIEASRSMKYLPMSQVQIPNACSAISDKEWKVKPNRRRSHVRTLWCSLHRRDKTCCWL